MGTPPRLRWFLREWRAYRGLTQEALGAMVGRTKGQISSLESGRTPYHQTILEALAVALRCTPADLISRKPDDPDDPSRIFQDIPPEQRERALRVMEAFREPFRHRDENHRPLPRRRKEKG